MLVSITGLGEALMVTRRSGRDTRAAGTRMTPFAGTGTAVRGTTVAAPVTVSTATMVGRGRLADKFTVTGTPLVE